MNSRVSIAARRLGRISVFVLSGLGLLPVGTAAQQRDAVRSTVSSTRDVMDTTIGPHGGGVVYRDQFMLETVVDPDGIRVYVADRTGQRLDPPASAGGVCLLPPDSTGSDRLEFETRKDSGKHSARYRSAAVRGGYVLFAPSDFTMSGDPLSRLRIELTGLPGQGASPIGFIAPFVLTRLRGWACRGHEDRVMTKPKGTPLCKKQYLVEVPYLFQCPRHENSRDVTSSKCPRCSRARVPTRQTMPVPPWLDQGARSRRR